MCKFDLEKDEHIYEIVLASILDVYDLAIQDHDVVAARLPHAPVHTPGISASSSDQAFSSGV